MIKVIENFITEEEENNILSNIRHSRVTVGKERNTVTRFGSRIPYNSNIKGEIPNYLSYLINRVGEIWENKEGYPDSLTINEYHKGQGIDWHVDSPTSGPVIAVLSLLSSATMGLRKENSEEKLFSLYPCSLLLLTEEDRWIYKHCIYPVDNKRFSIVFRKGTKLD